MLATTRLEDRVTPDAYVPGHVLLNIPNGMPEFVTPALRGGPMCAAARHVAGGLYDVTLPAGVPVPQAVAAFAASAGVREATPDYYATAQAVPNDPLYASAWHLETPADSDIDAAAAWDVGTGTGQSVVAVLDTGVNYAHPDLAPNVWRNPGEVPGNGVDDDRNGFVDDVVGWNFDGNNNNPIDGYGHGTAVAGVIGSVGNNGFGTVGVNWRARLMPVRVIGDDGRGTYSNIIAGIEYAARMGARVINASVAGVFPSFTMNDAIRRAYEGGTVTVASAGNEGRNTDDPATFAYYPARYAHLNGGLSVAALDRGGARSWYSNYGVESVTVAAPGDSIYSTYYGDGYGAGSGTSFASPVAAGVVSLLLDTYPTMTAAQAVRRVIDTVDMYPALNWVVSTGGRVNAGAALAAGPPSPAAPSASGSAAFGGEDRSTGGDWQGVYGADGYAAAGRPPRLPAYADAAVPRPYGWTWADSTGDRRGLAGSPRDATTWFHPTALGVPVDVAGGPKTVAVYMVDWDYLGRAARVDVLDRSGLVLDTRSVSGFGSGVWLRWNVSGSVTVRVTPTGSVASAVVSGVFFGPAGSGEAVPPEPAPGNSAAFARLDASTAGRWPGAYGSSGYLALGLGATLQPGFTAAVGLAETWVWADPTSDVRALRRPGGTGVARTWYSPSVFFLDVTVPRPTLTSFYFVDWDHLGRGLRVVAVDPDTNAVLDYRDFDGFGGGLWAGWAVSGRVRFYFASTGPVNSAVLSGVFFG